MAASVIVDAGFLVALLSGRDANHGWAAAQAARLPPPWATCEASVAEAFRLLGPAGGRGLRALLERRAAICAFAAGKEIAHLLKLMAKYDSMSFEDACLVRMTETMADPVVLTTDAELRTYRRLGRKTVPCVTPGQTVERHAEDTASRRESDPKGKADLDDILQDVTRIFRD
ncbi:MAG TPA: PIN domain-containing protein [Verrucomicrobiae bacterium]|jgi:predicted nucleic acid-binding protein|nr:PIN domain-containing protein [Verrucomicrobiae bacterium]